MRRLASFMLLLILAAFPVLGFAQDGIGSDGLGDLYFPTLGNGGYDAQHYSLDVNVDVPTNYLVATMHLEATATQALSQFNLDFEGMQVNAVRVNGVEAEFLRTGRELVIRPSTSLVNGQNFRVEVDYEGRPQPITPAAIPITIGWIDVPSGSYVASEPLGSSTWYPVNDHPQDKASYEFIITVPAGYDVAANGVFMGATDNGDGSFSHVWQANDPLASYLVTVNIGQFERVEDQSASGVPIRHYFPPAIIDKARYDFGNTAAMLDFFESVFGPYPFEVYGVIVIDAPFTFALETQTLSLFSARAVDGFRSVESTNAHELAHQWFGNSVSPAQWRDTWLNEGFATYASALWQEHRYGRSALDRWEESVYSYIQSESIFTSMQIGAPPQDNLFAAPVYLRGAMTLHALRLLLGDATFFNILRQYSADYAYSAVTTEDFITTAEAVSGRDLRAFFEAWLFEESIPPLPEESP